MSRLIVPCVFLLTAGAAMAQLEDRPGFKDPALFNRLPSHYLCEGGSVVEQQFQAYEFHVMKGKTPATEKVEGHYTEYHYTHDDDKGPRASALQIIRNYQNAAARIGGKVLFDNGEYSTIRVARGGQETWVHVEPGGLGYTLVVVERQAMQQDVVANADALKSGLAETGHVEVPGIFFDFGKADVKPESQPALKEVVALLQKNPSMRVWVVGHTDSVGSAETNVALSNARAASVIRMLTQQMGVDPKRLAPHGSGPYAPVASNKTEEGRAKNRRVELVEQ